MLARRINKRHSNLQHRQQPQLIQKSSWLRCTVSVASILSDILPQTLWGYTKLLKQIHVKRKGVDVSIKFDE